MPLALGIIAWIRRRDAGVHVGSGSAGAPAPAGITFAWYHFAIVFAIPMYFALATYYGDVVASGQDEAGLAALVAAHFFEHALDYLFVALLVCGTSGLLSIARRTPDHARS